jgi:hypothetical protein
MTIDDPRAVGYATPTVAAPRRYGTGMDIWNIVMRVIGVAASCVPLVVGLIAVARVDWSANGFSSPPVVVARMVFSPSLAIAMAAIGLIGVLAAASAWREPKFVWGALMACAGLVVLIGKPTIDHVVLVNRLGWMLLIVGAILAVTGLLMRRSAVVAGGPVTPAAY